MIFCTVPAALNADASVRIDDALPPGMGAHRAVAMSMP